MVSVFSNRIPQSYLVIENITYKLLLRFVLTVRSKEVAALPLRYLIVVHDVVVDNDGDDDDDDVAICCYNRLAMLI